MTPLCLISVKFHVDTTHTRETVCLTAKLLFFFMITDTFVLHSYLWN